MSKDKQKGMEFGTGSWCFGLIFTFHPQVRLLIGLGPVTMSYGRIVRGAVK